MQILICTKLFTEDIKSDFSVETCMHHICDAFQAKDLYKVPFKNINNKR